MQLDTDTDTESRRSLRCFQCFNARANADHHAMKDVFKMSGTVGGGAGVQDMTTVST